MERVRDDEGDPFAGLFKRILSRLRELILLFWKKNLVIKSISTLRPTNLLTLILKLLLLIEDYQEILADISDDQVKVSDNEEDESVEGEPVTKPGIEEARKAIQNLKKRR